MTETPTAHPLHWPTGWPRSKVRQFARFSHRERRTATNSDGSTRRWHVTQELTIAVATTRLQAELDLLGADHAILSTNVELRLDGLPRSGQKEPPDPGAACYFNLHGKHLVLACDKWTRVADNIAAIAAHIGAVRGQERWGVGSVDQAFLGYQALPAPGDQKPWWVALGFPDRVPLDVAETKYRELARLHHPDINPNGGALMSEITAAIAEARRAA